MLFDINTKVLARFHNEPNGTGLNIINPYFQDQKINAIYILFQNQNIKPLIEGLRAFHFSGAITAGFEKDTNLFKILDETTEAAKVSKRIGLVINRDGFLIGHYQAGEGLLAAIREKTEIKNKKIVVVGAGSVAKSFILALQQTNSKPREIVLYNRNVDNLEEIKKNFDLVTSVNNLGAFEKANGDILVNASRIGSTVIDELFDNENISSFSTVADVTFGTKESTLLLKSQKQNKTTVNGWDMFSFHLSVVLKQALDHEANIPKLKNYVNEGLSVVNHGAVAGKGKTD